MSSDSDELDYTESPEIMGAIREHSDDEAAAGHSEEVAENAPVEETAEAPETSEGPDLSFVDDDLQEELKASLPPEVLEVLATGKGKEYLLRQADYTRKTQDLAQQRKELKALKEAAGNWEKLSSDPVAMDAVISAWKGGQVPTPAEPENPEDLLLDPERLTSYIDEKVQEAEKRAYEKAVQAIQAPQQRNMELTVAAQEWMQAEGKEEAVVADAVRHIAEREGVENLTPDRLQSLLPDAVELLELRDVKSGQRKALQSNSTKVARARTASPRGGSGNGAAIEADMDASLETFKKQHGRTPTSQEFNAMAFQHVMASRGRTATDLDKELREQL